MSNREITETVKKSTNGGRYHFHTYEGGLQEAEGNADSLLQEIGLSQPIPQDNHIHTAMIDMSVLVDAVALTITQRNHDMNNEIYIQDGDRWGRKLAEGNTITQEVIHSGDILLNQLENTAHLRNAYGNRLEQLGYTHDSVMIKENVVGNRIDQGAGNDWLSIVADTFNIPPYSLYSASHDNFMHGGTGNDIINLGYAKSDFAFQFFEDGGFEIYFKHQGDRLEQLAGRFCDYEFISFSDPDNPTAVAELREEAQTNNITEEFNTRRSFVCEDTDEIQPASYLPQPISNSRKR